MRAAAHAEGKAAVSSCFMEQILQPTPSLLTSSPSPPHWLFNQLPSLSSSTLLFVLPRPYFPPHMLVGCKPLFMELLQLFHRQQPRPSLSNKSFTSQISKSTRQDRQTGKTPRNLSSTKYLGTKQLIKYKALSVNHTRDENIQEPPSPCELDKPRVKPHRSQNLEL